MYLLHRDDWSSRFGLGKPLSKFSFIFFFSLIIRFSTYFLLRTFTKRILILFYIILYNLNIFLYLYIE